MPHNSAKIVNLPIFQPKTRRIYDDDGDEMRAGGGGNYCERVSLKTVHGCWQLLFLSLMLCAPDLLCIGARTAFYGKINWCPLFWFTVPKCCAADSPGFHCEEKSFFLLSIEHKIYHPSCSVRILRGKLIPMMAWSGPPIVCSVLSDSRPAPIRLTFSQSAGLVRHIGVQGNLTFNSSTKKGGNLSRFRLPVSTNNRRKGQISVFVRLAWIDLG